MNSLLRATNIKRQGSGHEHLPAFLIDKKYNYDLSVTAPEDLGHIDIVDLHGDKRARLTNSPVSCSNLLNNMERQPSTGSARNAHSKSRMHKSDAGSEYLQAFP